MWIAQYNDGTQLDQFNLDGSENLFKNINQDKLKRFIIRSEQREIILNLVTGEVRINGLKLSFGFEDEVHRLIYFRRVRQILGSGAPSVVEYVGWQATMQGDSCPSSNVKRILMVEGDKVTIQCD